MLSTKLILENIGQSVVDTLKNDIKTKSLVAGFPPPNASGALYDSIRYEATEDSLKVYALDYIYYLVHGRKAGKKPPRAVIRKWIDDKGILPKDTYLAKWTLKDGSERSAERKYKSVELAKDSLAYVIQTKIGEKGTLIAQQGGSDLLSSILTESFIQNVKDELIFNTVDAIKSEILAIA